MLCSSSIHTRAFLTRSYCCNYILYYSGIDESALLKKVGGETYHETSRRPSQEDLEKAKLDGSELGKEIPTWTMSLSDFVRTYPDGEVFINDYKMFRNLKQPVKTICE